MAIGGQPVGVQEVDAGSHTLRDGHHRDRNRVELKRVLPPEIAQTETQILQTVIQYGTGKAASIGQFAAGKTGTTSNYGDAWFVGWDSKYTVAVWVGFPDKLVPMLTDFNGQPVMGGTFPALIWHDFIASALGIDKTRAEAAAAARAASGKKGTSSESEAVEEATGTSTTGSAAGGAHEGSGGSSTSAAPTAGGKEGSGSAGAAPHRAGPPTPAQEAPAQETPRAPAAPPPETS